MKQAILLFISSTPLPYNLSFSIVAEKGGKRQDSSFPAGTTSVCPAKARCFPDEPIEAKRFFTS